MTPAMACSSRMAASCSSRWWSIITPDSIIAVGLALFCPAYFGAEPWTGSNSAASVP